MRCWSGSRLAGKARPRVGLKMCFVRGLAARFIGRCPPPHHRPPHRALFLFRDTAKALTRGHLAPLPRPPRDETRHFPLSALPLEMPGRTSTVSGLFSQRPLEGPFRTSRRHQSIEDSSQSLQSRSPYCVNLRPFFWFFYTHVSLLCPCLLNISLQRKNKTRLSLLRSVGRELIDFSARCFLWA